MKGEHVKSVTSENATPDVMDVAYYCEQANGWSAVHMALTDFYRAQGLDVEDRVTFETRKRTIDRAHERAGQVVPSWAESRFSATEALVFICRLGIDVPDDRVVAWMERTGQVRPTLGDRP